MSRHTGGYARCEKPMNSRIRATIVLLMLLLGSSAHGVERRLESIKQQALALYTVRLADQRQFSPSVMMLIDDQAPDFSWRSVQVWIDDIALAQYAYSPRETQLLDSGLGQQLAIAQLSDGPHRVRVSAIAQSRGRSLRRTDTELSLDEELSFDTWPRGFSIQLTQISPQRARLRLITPLGPAALQQAAQYEYALGHPGKALTLLQNLAHQDPARTQQADYALLLGESLRAWGLASAAEATFDQLSASDGPSSILARARLASAELALERGALDTAAKNLLPPRGDSWPAAHLAQARTLETRIRLAGGSVPLPTESQAIKGSAIWRYNLAAALLESDQDAAAEQLLRDVASGPDDADSPGTIRDFANLKLGYRYLRRGEGLRAADAFASISADGPLANRALLGQGWAALATLSSRSAVAADDFRPEFVLRIEAGISAASGAGATNRADAINRAVELFSGLLPLNPLDPTVQEALVAIPYALAELGAYERAVRYCDRAIVVLEAVRGALLSARARLRNESAIQASALVSRGWPPRPQGWQNWATREPWWAYAKPVIPADAHVYFLLQHGETLRILEAMHLLQDAQAMTAAAAELDSLKKPAQQLSAKIDTERKRQQTTLDRHTANWLNSEAARSKRYLVMARLLLAQLHERMRNQDH